GEPVLAPVGQRGLELQIARVAFHLVAIARALQRGDEAEDGAVADERRADVRRVQRDGLDEALDGAVDDLVADEVDLFQLRLERLVLDAAGELDAPRLAERILGDGRGVVVAADLALLGHDVGEHLLSVDGMDFLAYAGERTDVREVDEVRAAVHAVGLVEVEDLAGDLVSERADARGAAALEGQADVVLAEDVAEVGADTAG